MIYSNVQAVARPVNVDVTSKSSVARSLLPSYKPDQYSCGAVSLDILVSIDGCPYLAMRCSVLQYSMCTYYIL